MRRLPVAEPSGPVRLVVRVHHGAHGIVAEWSPVTPPRGWTFPSARSSAMAWAVEQHSALGIEREALGASALRALGSAVDEAKGLRPGSARSLRHAVLVARLRDL